MLKRCTNCKQVVEIATYTDHLLNECEAKNNYSKCNRCTEAIPKSEYDSHVSEKSCNGKLILERVENFASCNELTSVSTDQEAFVVVIVR
jgi:hypothetical protein